MSDDSNVIPVNFEKTETEEKFRSQMVDVFKSYFKTATDEGLPDYVTITNLISALREASIEADSITFFHHALVDWLEATYNVKVESPQFELGTDYDDGFELAKAAHEIYEIMLEGERKKIQRDHAYKLADQVLQACKGDYREAISQLRQGLDCRENAPNEIHLEALGLLRQWKIKIGRDPDPS